jgi:hypothetical protein
MGFTHAAHYAEKTNGGGHRLDEHFGPSFAPMPGTHTFLTATFSVIACKGCRLIHN